MHLIRDIVDHRAETTQWRHDFHRHAELGHQEKRTAGRVAELLRSFGLDEVVEGFGGLGVVGVLRAGRGPSIGLRADMDALAICEAGTLDYASVNCGVMHACGHDGHMAMLLAAARYLAARRNFRGSVVFIFQHAEESVSGAGEMIEAGLFERFPLDAVYGLHNAPGPVGGMMIAEGAVMGAVNTFAIRVVGKGGHAGIPQAARDPVVAAAALIAGLQTIVSRRTDPNQPLALSVTGVRTESHTYNVIPGCVEIKGTVRYIDTSLEDRIPRQIRSIVEGICAAGRVDFSLDYQRRCPPLINTPAETAFARQVATELVGGGNVTGFPPTMAGEDFAFFLQQRPGCYAFVGNGIASAGIHHACYDFNDNVLPIGASYFARIVETGLAMR